MQTAARLTKSGIRTLQSTSWVLSVFLVLGISVCARAEESVRMAALSTQTICWKQTRPCIGTRAQRGMALQYGRIRPRAGKDDGTEFMSSNVGKFVSFLSEAITNSPVNQARDKSS